MYPGNFSLGGQSYPELILGNILLFEIYKIYFLSPFLQFMIIILLLLIRLLLKIRKFIFHKKSLYQLTSSFLGLTLVNAIHLS